MELILEYIFFSSSSRNCFFYLLFQFSLLHWLSLCVQPSHRLPIHSIPMKYSISISIFVIVYYIFEWQFPLEVSVVFKWNNFICAFRSSIKLKCELKVCVSFVFSLSMCVYVLVCSISKKTILIHETYLFFYCCRFFFVAFYSFLSRSQYVVL